MIALAEADRETLSPNAALVAQKLAVQSTAAPGAGMSVTITLRDDGADTAVACTIAGTATTCNSGASTATIAAGSKLSLKLAPTGSVAAASYLLGWQGS